MYEALFPIIGLFLGLLLAKLTKDELKQGEKYFRLICSLIIAVFFLILLWNNLEAKIFIGIALGLILGFFIFNPYLYLGLLAVITYSGLNRETFIVLSVLFSLSYISLYHKQANWKFILFCMVLFLLPYLSIPLKANIPWLLSGISIGGFFHVIRENYSGN